MIGFLELIGENSYALEQSGAQRRALRTRTLITLTVTLTLITLTVTLTLAPTPSL